VHFGVGFWGLGVGDANLKYGVLTYDEGFNFIGFAKLLISLLQMGFIVCE